MMALLFADSLLFIIGLVLCVILSIIGLFIGNIILFDSIIIALIAGILSNILAALHPAISLLIGAALFCVLLFVQNTRFGFWLIGAVLSLFWGFVFGFIAYIFTYDMIWFYAILVLGSLFVGMLHLHARN